MAAGGCERARRAPLTALLGLLPPATFDYRRQTDRAAQYFGHARTLCMARMIPYDVTRTPLLHVGVRVLTNEALSE